MFTYLKLEYCHVSDRNGKEEWVGGYGVGVGGAGGAGCERFDGVINNGVGGEDVTKRGNG